LRYADRRVCGKEKPPRREAAVFIVFPNNYKDSLQIIGALTYALA
jgi:hypothetical protein